MGRTRAVKTPAVTGNFVSDQVRLGDRVRWQGSTYRVDAFAGGQITLQPLPGTGAAVIALYGAVAGAADFAVLDEDGDPFPRRGLPPLGRLLQAASAADRKEALRWHRHMKEIDTGIRPGHRLPRPRYDPATTTVAQRCRAKAAELAELDGIRVSWRTLDDKRRKWKAAGEDPLVLIVDGRRGRARQPGGQTDPRTLQVMHEVTAELARESGVRIGAALDLIEERVRALYGPELADPQVAKRLLPPRPVAYRRMNELGLSKILAGTTRQRTSHAAKPRGPYRPPSSALKPGELIQLDTTPLHVKALGEGGRAISVELTAAIDVVTRSTAAVMIVPALTGEMAGGKRVGGRATRAFDLVLTLAQCFAPLPTLPGWDALTAAKASALPFGKLRQADPRFTDAVAARPVIHPRTIVIDQGSPYLSAHFARVCAFLGIALRYARKGHPDDKPLVERFFPTLADGFSQYLAGWSGRSHDQRGRGVERRDLFTLGELQQMAHEWVALEYQQLPHEGLRHPGLPGVVLSPNEMYAAMVGRSGYRPRPLSPEDNRQLLTLEWVTVSDTGFNIDNRTYQNYDGKLRGLKGLSSGLRGPGRGGRWEAHYNPYRPEVAWLFDHRADGHWIKAEFIHQHQLTSPWTTDHWEEATAHILEQGGRREHQAAITLAMKERRRRYRTAPPRAKRTEPILPFQGPLLEVDDEHVDPYADIGELDLDAVTPYASRPMRAGRLPQARNGHGPDEGGQGLAGLFDAPPGHEGPGDEAQESESEESEDEWETGLTRARKASAGLDGDDDEAGEGER